MFYLLLGRFMTCVRQIFLFADAKLVIISKLFILLGEYFMLS